MWEVDRITTKVEAGCCGRYVSAEIVAEHCTHLLCPHCGQGLFVDATADGGLKYEPTEPDTGRDGRGIGWKIKS